MNASRLREQLIEEWSKALAALAEYEASNVSTWSTRETLRLLHRIAAAG